MHANATRIIENGLRLAELGRRRYRPGEVSKVHADGTFDVVYDDGSKGRNITSDDVRKVEKRGRVKEGDAVEARRRGRSRYHPGKARRVHSDGTIDVDFEDGERERNVKAEDVRALDSNNKPMRVGDKVEAQSEAASRFSFFGRHTDYPRPRPRRCRDPPRRTLPAGIEAARSTTRARSRASTRTARST